MFPSSFLEEREESVDRVDYSVEVRRQVVGEVFFGTRGREREESGQREDEGGRRREGNLQFGRRFPSSTENSSVCEDRVESRREESGFLESLCSFLQTRDRRIVSSDYEWVRKRRRAHFGRFGIRDITPQDVEPISVLFLDGFELFCLVGVAYGCYYSNVGRGLEEFFRVPESEGTGGTSDEVCERHR